MIVSDSTTLIVLLDLERLDLLSNLFSNIIIPHAVYKEITAKKPIDLPLFIEVQTVDDCEVFDTLKLVLDLGESEAITLALLLDKPLIIDEKKGRKIAMRQGLKILGLLAVVYLNIKKNFMSREDAEVFLDDAKANGYRISEILIEQMFAKLD